MHIGVSVKVIWERKTVVLDQHVNRILKDHKSDLHKEATDYDPNEIYFIKWNVNSMTEWRYYNIQF